MARYIKTGTTEFEQFDGSDEMMDKYVIEEWPYEMARPDYSDNYFVIKTLEGNVFFAIGDWIATGVNGEHWPVKDEIFKKTYKRLPRITDRVAQIIESAKKSNESLADVISAADIALTYTTIPIAERKDKSWILNHSAEFARAWLDGYEVADA